VFWNAQFAKISPNSSEPKKKLVLAAQEPVSACVDLYSHAVARPAEAIQVDFRHMEAQHHARQSKRMHSMYKPRHVVVQGAQTIYSDIAGDESGVEVSGDRVQALHISLTRQVRRHDQLNAHCLAGRPTSEHTEAM